MTTKSEKVAGHAKEVAGIVTNDKDLEKKGSKQRETAEAQSKVDEAKHAVVHVVDKGQTMVNGAFDKVKEFVGGK